jgi:hypothetical protein
VGAASCRDMRWSNFSSSLAAFMREQLKISAVLI